MKYLFYGNCQAQVTMRALRLCNEGLEAEYTPNTDRLANYDPECTKRLFEWADIIVSQPVMNIESADHHSRLRTRLGGRLVFMPYLFFPAFFDLSSVNHDFLPGRSRVIEETIVLQHLQTQGLDATIAAFVSGRMALRKAEQLEANLQELERREELCQIRIASYFRAHLRDRPLMITHNHPTPEVVNELARRAARHFGLAFSPITPKTPLLFQKMILPADGKRVLSPYTAADIGLRYDHDLHWLAQGRDLILEVARANGLVKANDRDAGG